MSFLKVVRAILLLTAVLTLSASADVDAVESNSTNVNNATATTRNLEEAATDYHTLLLNAVNKERAARGLSKLCRNRKLQSAAQIHSNDMAKRNFLSHSGSDGSTITSRIRSASFHWTVAAENVAAGQATVNNVMSSWMKSSGHRANILSKRYKFFGCGYTYTSSSKYNHYWTQNFASGTGEVCG